MLCVGTLCALRASELRQLDVYDVLDGIDGKDTMAIQLWKRKNDRHKRGLYPRICKARNPAFCVNNLIRMYLHRAGLQVSKNCTKTKY